MSENLQKLADTLHKNGLASSATEALSMAKNIMGTENRVSKSFDHKADVIDKSLDRKEDTMQELIKKTSFENKNFHIPIRGYNLDDKPRNQPVQSVPVQHTNPEHSAEQQQLSQLQNNEVLDSQIPLNQLQEEIQTSVGTLKAAPMPYVNPATAASIDNVPINQVVEQPQQQYNQPVPQQSAPQQNTMPQSNTQGFSYQTPQTPSVDPNQVPDSSASHHTSQNMQNHTPLQPSQQEEPAVRELEGSKPTVNEQGKKEFKNPIEKVDLSQYFSFG